LQIDVETCRNHFADIPLQEQRRLSEFLGSEEAASDFLCPTVYAKECGGDDFCSFLLVLV
jgi:hypothetical protein